MTIIIFSLTLLLLYFLICILFFGFVVFWTLLQRPCYITFFDCRGLAYSCVIIEYLEVFLDDVYQHTTIFIIIRSII